MPNLVETGHCPVSTFKIRIINFWAFGIHISSEFNNFKTVCFLIRNEY